MLFYHNILIDLGNEDARDVSLRLREFALGVCVPGGFSISIERENYRACLVAEKTITKCQLERQARIRILDFDCSFARH